MKVCNLIRRSDAHPHDLFSRGIEACGDKLTNDHVRADFVITWNSYGYRAEMAAETRGCWLEAENGFFHVRGNPTVRVVRIGEVIEPRYTDMARFYGTGLTTERWKRTEEGYFLVCGQRGGQYNPAAMSDGWPTAICRDLLDRHPGREVVYRPHPGRLIMPRLKDDRLHISNVEVNALEDDLDLGAYQTVVWTSLCTIQSVIRGIPACALGPMRFGRQLMSTEPGILRREFRGLVLSDLANRQWTYAEIESGAAWAVLRERYG